MCPLCQQPHTSPLQDRLCQLRLQIINLRLELRELMREERKLTNQLQITNGSPVEAGAERNKMFTNEEIRWFVEAACGQWVKGCKVEEGSNGVIIVTEPNGKVHEVKPVCVDCGDATGTCEHA